MSPLLHKQRATMLTIDPLRAVTHIQTFHGAK
jgi:hypothetical protein